MGFIAPDKWCLRRTGNFTTLGVMNLALKMILDILPQLTSAMGAVEVDHKPLAIRIPKA